LDPLTEEFMELFRLSGWKNQAEVARKLDLTPGAVSDIFSGKNPPGKRLVKYFRLVLFHEQPELLGRKGNLTEDAPRGDLQIWRDRARVAEEKLEKLRASLRRALDDSAVAPMSEAGDSMMMLKVVGANSDPEADQADQAAEAILGEVVEETKREESQSHSASKADSAGGGVSYKPGGAGKVRGVKPRVPGKSSK
jgi:transcriptional regulator with XRE-family HTH domain